MKTLPLVLAVAAACLPFAALDAATCAPGPSPPLGTSVGWTADNWPQDETIRFSAAPGRERHAYAVQISRAGSASDAAVHLTKLVRGSCGWELEQEWRFPLGADDANIFLERISDIESGWRPDGQIVTDGTLFQYEHRRGGVITRLRLSADAMGESGRLSNLILSLVRIARGEVPTSPKWSEYAG
jgi:hypothetical protein